MITKVVHKIYYELTKCGKNIHNEDFEFSWLWKKVTCKKCLELKPKRKPMVYRLANRCYATCCPKCHGKGYI